MKKRVGLLALAAAMVLAVCGAGWAGPESWPAPWLTGTDLTVGIKNPNTYYSVGHDTWLGKATYAIDILGDEGTPLYAPEGHCVRRHGDIVMFHTGKVGTHEICFPGRAGATELFSGKVYAGDRAIIETDGTLTNPKVKVSLDPVLDAEAVRVVMSLPNKWIWDPSRCYKGEIYRCLFMFVVSFE